MLAPFFSILLEVALAPGQSWTSSQQTRRTGDASPAKDTHHSGAGPYIP